MLIHCYDDMLANRIPDVTWRHCIALQVEVETSFSGSLGVMEPSLQLLRVKMVASISFITYHCHFFPKENLSDKNEKQFSDPTDRRKFENLCYRLYPSVKKAAA